MKRLIHFIYIRSPFFFKRVFVNIEAIRRDKYRKNKGNNTMVGEVLSPTLEINSFQKVDSLIKYAGKNVKYYSFLENLNIQSAEDFKKIPLLTKQIIREKKEQLISKQIKNKKELWSGKSSGSTGMPLNYYRDKESVFIEREQYNLLYKQNGLTKDDNKVRFSGVKIATFNRKKPPYWIYVDKYKQLQCSSYHLADTTILDYLGAFKNIDAKFGTGFPSSWSNLAELMLDNGIYYEGFKAIITDSEGLSEKQKEIIEKAFKCNVYQTYGLGEVGMCSYQCNMGNYHILPSHYVEIVSESGDPVLDGEEGQIVITDLNSKNYPFIRYATGDLGIMGRNNCSCNLKGDYLTKVIGRIEDYILTKDNRKITRLTEILKPGVGIKESQIVQITKEKIIINIVPSKNFERASMKLVVDKAKDFIGNMEVAWQEVEKLERMPSGKVKFLIRKI